MMMRVMLVQSALGLNASSGGYKANLALLKGLQEDGHTVCMLANVNEEDLKKEKLDYKTTSLPLTQEKAGNDINIYTFTFNKIDVIALDCDTLKKTILDPDNLPKHLRWLQNDETFPEQTAYQNYFLKETNKYKPTHLIVNDSTALKLSELVDEWVVRIFIIHATEHLPFGPEYALPEAFSGSRSDAEWKRLLRANSVWSVSDAIGKFAREHGKVDYTLVPIHPNIYGDLPSEQLMNYDADYVIAINPGILKGFPIFTEITKLFPDVKFGAVTSWSFTKELAEELKELPNVEVLPSFSDMDDLWKKTRVLLMPSLFFESFGLVVVEAMLRGIPVLASDRGGLVEAHCGVDYSLPVSPLEVRVDANDPQKVTFHEPSHNIKPWADALKIILDDRKKYDQLSIQSRDASMKYVKGIDRNQYTRLLREAWQKKFGEKKAN